MRAEMVLDPATPRREYISKLHFDFRRDVLNQGWPLDGEDKPARRPATWEEVSEAVDMELEQRADAHAPQDSVNALGAPPTSQQGMPTS